MSTRRVFTMLAVSAVLVGMGLFAVTAMAGPITVTFQDGAVTPTEAGGDGSALYAGTTDNTVAGYPSEVTLTNGANPQVWVGDYNGDTSDVNRSLVNFNYGTLATYMQANNLQIQAATLKLYYTGTANGLQGQTVDAFKSTTAFDEATSCWSYRTGTTPWAGGSVHSASDFSSTLLDSQSLINASVGWKSFDVTNAFASNGSDLGSQVGLTLLARIDSADPDHVGATGADQVLFGSCQYGTQSYRPEMVFTLTTVPEPSTCALAITAVVGLLAYAWRKRK